MYRNKASDLYSATLTTCRFTGPPEAHKAADFQTMSGKKPKRRWARFSKRWHSKKTKFTYVGLFSRYRTFTFIFIRFQTERSFWEDEGRLYKNLCKRITDNRHKFMIMTWYDIKQHTADIHCTHVTVLFTKHTVEPTRGSVPINPLRLDSDCSVIRRENNQINKSSTFVKMD